MTKLVIALPNSRIQTDCRNSAGCPRQLPAPDRSGTPTLAYQSAHDGMPLTFSQQGKLPCHEADRATQSPVRISEKLAGLCQFYFLWAAFQTTHRLCELRYLEVFRRRPHSPSTGCGKSAHELGYHAGNACSFDSINVSDPSQRSVDAGRFDDRYPNRAESVRG